MTRVIFQRRNPRPTNAAIGRHVKDEHDKDAAQDAAEGRRGGRRGGRDIFLCHRTWRRTWLAFGARAARALLATQPPPPPPSVHSSRLAKAGAQLGSSVARGERRRWFRGCR